MMNGARLASVAWCLRQEISMTMALVIAYLHFLPAHVESEFRRFLECGILSRGFCRLVCEKCGAERVVAFSCKGRA
ncbi:MAG: transposase zinc-binding domain-containing protein, partial [Deltaproteobacteria bacterium]|nr:transposase zinc-binding domain-containing protein [Deltaproteobacteria bacterium]